MGYTTFSTCLILTSAIYIFVPKVRESSFKLEHSVFGVDPLGFTISAQCPPQSFLLIPLCLPNLLKRQNPKTGYAPQEMSSHFESLNAIYLGTPPKLIFPDHMCRLNPKVLCISYILLTSSLDRSYLQLNRSQA